MTVRVYKSTDASAPTLTGQVGSLIGLLDACLVNGYGSNTAAGWAKSFSGTNKAAYRPGAGNQHYYRFDDTAAQNARVRGYESMSDVDTGVGLFPTEVQFSGGLHFFKSDAANTTARGWILVADEKRFWLVSTQGAASIDASTTYGQSLFCGDIISFKSGDGFHSMVIAADGSNSSSGKGGQLTGSLANTINAHYFARTYTQIGASVAAGKHSDHVKLLGTARIGSNGVSYPDPVTGGILIAPVYAHENSVTRGRIPGLWCPLHNQPGAPGDTFGGNGDLTGRSFILVDIGDGNNRSRAVLEISDTWE